MNTLILYASSHGCTEKYAGKLKNLLGSQTKLINLKKSSSPDLKNIGTVIIGGSIHAGQIQKCIKKFCQSNINELKEKKTGLFICCMEEDNKAEVQFNNAYPEEIIRQSTANGIFGGEFNFEKMNFFEKLIVKKIAKVNSSISKFDETKVEKFAADLNKIPEK